ncbi:DNA mismatch repair protein MutL, partial [Aeromonas caviae]
EGVSAAHQDAPLAETLVELPVSPQIEYPGQAPRPEWYGAEHSYRAPAQVREGGAARASNYQPPEPPSREAMRGMGALLTTLPIATAAETAPEQPAATVPSPKQGGCRALTLVDQTYLLIERDNQLALLSLVRAERVLLRHWLLETWGQGLAAQPLLLPVSFKLPKNLIALVTEQERLLKRMGLELKSGGRDTMILTRVPALLRQTDLVRLLPELLQIIEG